MRTQSRDTRPEAERVLIDLLRKAPVSKRFALVRSMTEFTARLRQQNMRELHPDISEQEVTVHLVSETSLGKTLPIEHIMHELLINRTSKIHTDLLALIVSATDVFEQLGITYYIKGSIATSLYGMQRTAFRADFIADFCPDQIDTLLEHFQQTYYIDAQEAKKALLSGSSFEGIHFESMLTIIVAPSKNNAFDQTILRRIQQHALTENDDSIYVASPEDVVLTQLNNYQMGGEIADDQWNDMLGVLKVQRANLDFAYLQQWANALNIDHLFEKACIDAGLKEK